MHKWSSEIVPEMEALLEEYAQDIDLYHIAFPPDWKEQLPKTTDTIFGKHDL